MPDSFRIAADCSALVRSDERPEDSAELGAALYDQLAGDASSVLVVGVSVGLSADFVAG